MWSSLCVNVSEILEVRGSPLTEEEAWVLLYEIGRRLKNVPSPGSQRYIIVPDNIELHHNGGLSIKFADHQHNKIFPDLTRIKLNNALVYSLGMAVLYCLQNGVPEGMFLDISEELFSVLSMMTSPKCSPEELEAVLSRGRFKTKDWENTVSECFKDMYQSIFGSTSDLKIDQYSDSDQALEVISEVGWSDQNFINNKACEPVTNHPSESNHAIEDTHLKQEEQFSYEDDFTQTEWIGFDSTISHFPTHIRRSESGVAESHEPPTSPKSMLRCKEPPKSINLCTEKSDFRKVSRVTVEYLDGKKLSVSMEADKISSGHLLGLALPHLAASVNPAVFCLTCLRDGEYIIASPTSSIQDMAHTHPQHQEFHFYVRLRFIPQDVNSIQESALLQAMYLQTRKDLLEGLLPCSTEEALLLAAYSLQYEVGNVSRSSKPFRMRDFVPATIIERHGLSYLRASLSSLHERLNGMDNLHARTLFLCKAEELPDFGTHLMRIFLTRKCEDSASGWLSVGPKGMKVLKLPRQNHSILHEFVWDQLRRLAYKNNTVTLITKSKTKLKFFLRRERRSKYIVQVIGETHQHHRYDDFHASEQFYHPAATSRVHHRHDDFHASEQLYHPTATSSVHPQPLLPFVHKKLPPETKNEPQTPQKLEIPRNTIPSTNLMPAETVDGGSNLSLCSGHPQITPFEPAGHDNTVSELEEDFREMDIQHRPSDHAVYRTVAKAEVHETTQDDQASEQSEDSAADVFDPSDIPPPMYDITPNVLHSTMKINHETAQEMDGNHFREISEVMPEADTFVEPHGDDLDIMTSSLTTSHITPNVSLHKAADIHPGSNTDAKPDVKYSHKTSFVDTEESQAAFREENASRGEGDGISNFSGPDHQSDFSKSNRYSSKTQSVKDEVIPESATLAIADFEEFKRRLSKLKSANESSSESENSGSWSGVQSSANLSQRREQGDSELR